MSKIDNGPFFVAGNLVYSRQPQRARRGSGADWCNRTSISISLDPRDLDGNPTLSVGMTAAMTERVAMALNAHDDLVEAAKELHLRHINHGCHTCDHSGAQCDLMARLKKAGVL